MYDYYYSFNCIIINIKNIYPLSFDFSTYMEKGKIVEIAKDKEVQNVLKLLNNRSRKCINYKTPQELFNEYLCECCTRFDKLSS